MTWDMSKVIGHNARVRRTELAMDVATFGARMEEALGRPWKRQTVSAMENGDRAMTANDLVAIAHVLEQTPAMLLVPPLEAEDIQVGNLRLEPAALMTGSMAQESAALLIELMDDVRDVWGAAGRAKILIESQVIEQLESIDNRITGYLVNYGKGSSNGEGD
ncbi:hypothetical protein [Arthrobacter cavernae]|uniref:HTH cro/C1-type domain-containing protein n=1 Tax=Arthrobacter cavernae TaxID=2817681 RepID=A0A939KNS3_9MICC|nr:hypothetical protein [Arthrobacter cavernae]MBO1269596.1 hypothetical protein [Arthrobacter cavernae]